MGSLVGAREHRKRLARFGKNLGMAFQIADDLLDYTGSEAETGKPTGHDLRERKVTLPLVGALVHAAPAESREIRTFFTRTEPTDEEIGRIIDIVSRRGGLEYARAKARHYADLAEASLEGLPAGDAVDALRDSVSYTVDRSR